MVDLAAFSILGALWGLVFCRWFSLLFLVFFGVLLLFFVWVFRCVFYLVFLLFLFVLVGVLRCWFRVWFLWSVVLQFGCVFLRVSAVLCCFGGVTGFDYDSSPRRPFGSGVCRHAVRLRATTHDGCVGLGRRGCGVRLRLVSMFVLCGSGGLSSCGSAARNDTLNGSLSCFVLVSGFDYDSSPRSTFRFPWSLLQRRMSVGTCLRLSQVAKSRQIRQIRQIGQIDQIRQIRQVGQVDQVRQIRQVGQIGQIDQIRLFENPIHYVLERLERVSTRSERDLERALTRFGAR